MLGLRRREFITLLGGAAAAWPITVLVQQPSKTPIIGFLGQSTALAQSQWTAAFLGRLRELGWDEGRTVAVEYRWAEGHSERFAEIATEFAERKVDVIVSGSPRNSAARGYRCRAGRRGRTRPGHLYCV
jgi:putative ABC transport system substrate-binding protein